MPLSSVEEVVDMRDVIESGFPSGNLGGHRVQISIVAGECKRGSGPFTRESEAPLERAQLIPADEN